MITEQNRILIYNLGVSPFSSLIKRLGPLQRIKMIFKEHCC